MIQREPVMNAHTKPEASPEVTAHVVQLPHAVGLALPAYETEGSAGLDLRAAITEGEELTLKPMARALVPTGLKMSVPLGYEVQVRPRSGLALKFGITCLNTPARSTAIIAARLASS